jgi:hypothetical protein
MPLTKQELAQYIQHRLTVAGCARPLFDKGALNKIHQLSQGVPRLTNLLCHSALMLAYNQNDSVVNKKTVVAAAGRALGEELTSKDGRVHYNGVLIFSTVISVAAFFALAGFWWGQTPINDTVLDNHQENVINEQSNGTKLVKVVVDKSESKQLLGVGEGATQLTQLPLGTSASPEESAEKNTGTTEVISESPPQKATNTSDKKAITIKGNNRSINQTNKATTEKLAADSIKDKTIVLSASKPNLLAENKQELNYKVTEVAGVSSDLLARFQAAIDETSTENLPSSQSNNFSASDSTGDKAILESNEEVAIRALTQMPQHLQNNLPSLQFEQHIYASDGQGWVNVNGRDRYEGDYISDGLVVEKILPQQVILSFQGEKFSLPALTNW